eukprot:GCRY01005688.1.p1 GENE.GCRY01005688.1~~GCRY01005688.1.p1  ORF type:complete len:403 (+),score=61.68 GCRY01005688.1:92-1300(+)
MSLSFRVLKAPKHLGKEVKVFLENNHYFVPGLPKVENTVDCLLFFVSLQLRSEDLSASLQTCCSFEEPTSDLTTRTNPPKKSTNANTLHSSIKAEFGPTTAALIKKSRELVGDLLIIETPKEFSTAQSKRLGEIFLKFSPQAKTVLKKVNHVGPFRVQEDVEVLAGENRTHSVVKENGVQIFVDIKSVFYSSRMVKERKRLTELCQAQDSVLVMFSGTGPFPLSIAKCSKPSRCVAIDLNSEASKCAVKGCQLNKLLFQSFDLVNGVLQPACSSSDSPKVVKNNRRENAGVCVEIVTGDAREVGAVFPRTFSRILMPAPHNSIDYFPDALQALKGPVGTIHLYEKVCEAEFSAVKARVDASATALGWVVRSQTVHKIGQLSASGQFRICIDVSLEQKSEPTA